MQSQSDSEFDTDSGFLLLFVAKSPANSMIPPPT